MEGFGRICVAPVCKFWTLFQKCFAFKMIARSPRNLVLQIRNFLTGRCLLWLLRIRSAHLTMACKFKVIFARFVNVREKKILASVIGILKRKLEKTRNFSEILELQFGNKIHPQIQFCTLKLFKIIVASLSLKTAWLPPILFLDFNISKR